jgi:hypothetical protein
MGNNALERVLTVVPAKWKQEPSNNPLSTKPCPSSRIYYDHYDGKSEVCWRT